MDAEENPPAPNWLVKLEEQREKRLKVKLGHEAGAGALCQNCGDKCPGLDLHFWRKICKICKCGKEDHDITDDDVCGFVQFQLLGSKPTKAKSIFLAGKKDPITLEWTPKGSNTDVKRYLEELPDHLLPVKGSEAAKIRKQRLQKQMPAHDIDASLCHALTPSEIEQLEEYVAHIRKHSVGQGKVIQLSLLRGQKHKFGNPNTQFLTQYSSGQLASSQTVYLQSSDIANNLHNLAIQSDPDKNLPGNRVAFLNSQIPNEPVLSSIDEREPETVGYRNVNLKSHPNYLAQSIHQIVESQNPITVGKVSDIQYQVNRGNASDGTVGNSFGAGSSEPISGSDLLGNVHGVAVSSPYGNQGPEFVGKLGQKSQGVGKGNAPFTLPEGLGKGVQNPNLSDGSKMVQKVPFSHQNSEFLGHPAQNVAQNLSHFTQNPYIGGQNLDNVSNSSPYAQNPEGYINVDNGPKNILYGQNTVGHKNMTQNLDNCPSNLQYGQNLMGHKNLDNSPNNLPYGQNSVGHKNMVQNLDNCPNNLPYGPNSVGHNNMVQNLDNCPNLPYGQNPEGFTNFGSGVPNIGNLSNVPFSNQNVPYACEKLSNVQNPKLSSDYYGQNPEYSGQIPDNARLSNQESGKRNPSLGLEYPNALDNFSHIPSSNKMDKTPIHYPLTTTNVERHQEQFLNPNFDSEIANPSQNNPNFTTENATNPNDYPNFSDNVNSDNYRQNPNNFSENAVNNQPKYNLSDDIRENNLKMQDQLKNRVPIPILNAENKINPIEFEQSLSSVGYLRDIDYNNQRLPTTDPYDLVNSNVIPSCHKCKKVFEDGSLAVSVDRTENLWHPNCFNCSTCEQPLADLLYFYHKETDNIYCGRDYALLKGIPRCAACDELIFVREYCLAEESTFHVKHFCCFECDEPLAGNQYLMESNQPVCVDCYEKLKAEKCTDCGYVIRPEQQGVSLQNLHWHAEAECFACKNCRKSLLGAKMLLRNQNLFCSDVCFKSY